jgi:DNA-binding CsgD family transcriptional regulator
MAQGARAAAEPDDGGVAGLLQRLTLASSRRLRAAAGSVSLVDASGNRYAKLAEHGTSCQLGGTFPLDEGITGQVVARRRPVVLASYDEVRTGHLAIGTAARHGAVIAVPLWWRGDVVGANVVFAGRARRFTVREIDDLELLTQTAVPRLVRVAAGEPGWGHLIRRATDGDRSLAVVPPLPASAAQGQPTRSPLTRRERETVALLADGLSNRQMAAALVLSPKTVDKHVAAVLRKTGTVNRVAAVMTALDRGWLTRPAHRSATG